MSKENLQGSMNFFGPRTSEVDNAAEGADLVRTLVQPIYTVAGAAELAPADFNAGDTVNVIPAYSYIKSCSIHVVDAFTSTATATGIDVGLVQADDGSTEVDFDGLIDVTGVGAKANLTAYKADAGDGPLIGADIGAEDAVIYAQWAAGTDTLTGTAIVVVEFIPPLDAYLADKT